ncbi:O-antigen polymerase [Pseudomonas sp. MBLB4136]|uniref:O-antigen polymerase n=1 Tax=Pseudomonas sp. MBLB4136 TaxID=3451558 RepID=UPI003F755D7A
MNELLVILNLVLPVVYSLHALKKTGTHASLIVYGMHVVYFSLMPSLHIAFGFSVYKNLHMNDILNTYLICGVIGITLMHVSLITALRLNKKFIGKHIFERVNSAEKTKRSLVASLLLLGGGAYVITFFKTGDFLYVFNPVNSFEVMMSLARGKYFLNFISGGLVYLCLYIVYIYGEKDGKFHIPLVCLVVFIYFILAQPATRTWVLTMLLSIIFLRHYPSRKLLSRTTVVAIFAAPVLIVLLHVLNYSRLGDYSAISLGTFFKGSLTALYLNFLQFENGLSLIEYFKSHDFLYFRFLVAALSPLAAIPSAILPFEKPRADKEAHLTELIFGDELNLNFYHLGSTLTYTIPMSGYADFGYFGTIVACVIYGMVLGLIAQGISYGGLVRFISLYLFVSFSAGYRLGVEGLLLSVYNFVIMNAVFLFFFKVKGFLRKSSRIV